tara:strand:+ start:491 stop:700 length:210 start_codon:yes stop_codon:yes gene_type:complete
MNKVYKLKIKQGTVFVAADTKGLAEDQVRALQHHLHLRLPGVRQHTEITPGVFALGTEAKKKAGVTINA